MPKIYDYLANELGFHEYGRLALERIKRDVTLEGITPLEPFEICGEFAPTAAVNATDSYAERLRLLAEFKRQVRATNEDAMRRCQLMIPLLDGSHGGDPGVADEVRFFFENKLGPIYALRTDMRGSENPATRFHPHTDEIIAASGGKIYESRAEWLKAMHRLFMREYWRE